MICKGCGRHMLIGGVSTCERCRKHQAKLEDMKSHYQHSGDYKLTDAVLDCKRHHFTTKEIAHILNVDIKTIEWEVEILHQNAQ